MLISSQECFLTTVTVMRIVTAMRQCDCNDKKWDINETRYSN